MNNATCPAPWIGLYLDQYGAKPCCEYSGPPLLNFETLRLSMQQGLYPKGCSGCEQRAASGDRTLQYYLRQQFPDVDYFDHDQDPQFMQIRFDNLCNASCRMCNADSSNLWHQDDIALGRTDLIDKPSVRSSGSFESLTARYDLSKIKRVHIFGGEPLIQENALKLFDEFADRSDVTVQYNTNLSKLHHGGHNILDFWARAKCKIEVSASIEGTSTTFEYIRAGLSWLKFVQNCNEVMKLAAEHEGRISFSLHTTQSILSAAYFPDVLDFLVELNKIQRTAKCYTPITLSSAMITQPDYLNLRNMPPLAKLRMITWLNQIERNAAWKSHPHLARLYAALIDWIQSREGSLEKMREFWRCTDILDRRRAESIHKQLPELALMIRRELSDPIE